MEAAGAREAQAPGAELLADKVSGLFLAEAGEVEAERTAKHVHAGAEAVSAPDIVEGLDSVVGHT